MRMHSLKGAAWVFQLVLHLPLLPAVDILVVQACAGTSVIATLQSATLFYAVLLSALEMS